MRFNTLIKQVTFLQYTWNLNKYHKYSLKELLVNDVKTFLNFPIILRYQVEDNQFNLF